MPFYIVERANEDSYGPYDVENMRAYTTRVEALPDVPDSKHTVICVPTFEERDSWHARENGRRHSSAYRAVPWAQRDNHFYHFAHLSEKQPGMVAYTKNDEHGLADRQTVVRPGRYLEQYYSNAFSQAERTLFVSMCNVEFMTLKFARTADEIQAVYTNGPNSCMCHAPDSYSSPVHPVRAYGDSDLGVAYYGDPAIRVSARCVVWPDRMRYGRIYGDAVRLETMLTAAGYTNGSMTGARIKAISHDDQWIVPYIDGATKLDDSEARSTGWLRIGRGNVSAEQTDGLATMCRTATCNRCDRQYEENEDTDPYCSRCNDERMCCEACDEDTWDAVRTETAYLCESCANDERCTCVMEDCDNTWFNRDLTAAQRRDRDLLHTEDLCLSCAESYQVCRRCDDAFDINDVRCPNCEQAARCEHTEPLPLECENPYDNPDYIYDTEPRS